MNNGSILTSAHTPFGADFNIETNCIDFRLFSVNGKTALLCLFDEPRGKDAVLTLKMVKNGDIFETSFNPALFSEFQGVLEGKPLYYGYRVFGANYEYTEGWEPGSENGFVSKLDNSHNRFNPNKLAYDPYTKELSHLHHDVDPNLENFRSGINFFLDNQKLAPKSVFKLNKEAEIVKTSIRALNKEIIGEVHIKSLTMLGNTLPDDAHKGTFKGAGEFAAHLKELGITMVEFLPLFEFDNNEDIGNYWGYMPLCYFALHKKYAFNTSCGETITEFREMVQALHKADIKVCLDVVYNHTGEARVYNGNREDVNLFSYALIDNAHYYKTDSNGFYVANSGCHNDSNTAGQGFKNIIVDSLEYWIHQGIDAFRFDLAVSLMDTNAGAEVHYEKNNSIIGRLKEELENRGIKVNNPDESADGVNLIAEPWTCGGKNAYQLGNFPDFFAEWNDISRNTIRSFTIHPESLEPLYVRYLLEGTPQKFSDPSRCVNYVACHDGFTLWDLNSYDRKAPTTCGGSDWELCSSCRGSESLRAKSIRNQTALLTLSAGCFMMEIGDIVLHSKGGNNNSYNLDSEVNYIEFNGLCSEKAELSAFIKNLISFRKAFKPHNGAGYIKDCSYFNAGGETVKKDDMCFWLNKNEHFLAFLSGGKEESAFLAINKGEFDTEFTLPPTDKKYYFIFDTVNGKFEKGDMPYEGKTYKMAPHTIVLMLVK